MGPLAACGFRSVYDKKNVSPKDTGHGIYKQIEAMPSEVAPGTAAMQLILATAAPGIAHGSWSSGKDLHDGKQHARVGRGQRLDVSRAPVTLRHQGDAPTGTPSGADHRGVELARDIPGRVASAPRAAPPASDRTGDAGSGLDRR